VSTHVGTTRRRASWQSMTWVEVSRGLGDVGEQGVMGQQGLGGMGEHACGNNQKEGLVAVYDLGGGEQGSGGCGRACIRHSPWDMSEWVAGLAG
jgi:hypothetical protein